MSVRKRLFISNILMIVIPVVVTIMAAFLCAGLFRMAFSQIESGNFEDSEDFYDTAEELSDIAGDALDEPERYRLSSLNELSRLLDMGNLSMVILKDGTEYFSSGRQIDASTLDRLKERSANTEDEESFSSSGYDVYVSREYEGGSNYLILVYVRELRSSRTGFMIVFILSVCIMILAIFLSIFFANRFLTGFVFRHIEEPLGLLSAGVDEISKGNLDYRLDYQEKDEFRPVCESFNDMALRLKESVARTRREEESRKELMASLSHDLRSPLTSIQAYVEGLLDGVATTEESKQHYLMTIKSKSEELERLIGRILIYSRMELEDVPKDAGLIDIGAALQHEIDEIYDDYAGRGLYIKADLLSFPALTDREELKQILLNIADNSLKYKIKENGNLTISLKNPGNEGVLDFTDDGPGVPTEVLPKLFDIFYRTDPARTDRAKGSGLGLAIVKKAAERMGGRVRAENARGGGLSIIITIPGSVKG